MYGFAGGYTLSNSKVAVETEKESKPKDYLTAIAVRRGDKTTLVDVDKVLYISADSPYIGIHTTDGTFLVSDTLKSIIERLDPDVFMRVHKSTIINTAKVVACQSRLNGDYDLVLENGAVVRMSRNFSADFKSRHL